MLILPCKAQNRQSQQLSRRLSRAHQQSFQNRTLTYNWDDENFNETFDAETYSPMNLQESSILVCQLYSVITEISQNNERY